MAHDDVIVFFCQIGVMLGVAIVCGQVMRRFHQPAVLGELIGGVLIGPTVLKSFFPDAYAWLFPDQPAIVAGRDAVIRIGMLFFLFVAGLEVNLGLLRQRGLVLLLTSTLGAVIPFAVGVAAAFAAPSIWGVSNPQSAWTFALFLGTALSISALPVIARILMDLNLVRQPIGMIILSAATINDVVGWTLFAVILGTIQPDQPPRSLGLTVLQVFMFSAGVFILARIVTWVLFRQSKTLPAWSTVFIGTSGVLVLLAAATAESIGLHAVFGAFLVGVSLGHGMTPEEEHRAHHIIHQFAVSFFAPLYFVSVGLRADFAHHFDLLLVSVVVAIACIGKIAGAGLGAWLGGMPKRDALAVGFGMNARGAMEMILATVALEHGLIDVRIFVALVVMALVTSLISGPALRRLLRKSADDEHAESSRPESEKSAKLHS